MVTNLNVRMTLCIYIYVEEYLLDCASYCSCDIIEGSKYTKEKNATVLYILDTFIEGKNWCKFYDISCKDGFFFSFASLFCTNHPFPSSSMEQL